MTISIILLAMGMAGDIALASVQYVEPPGGWTYIYSGDQHTAGPLDSFDSLDGTWDHNNVSDEWDGTQIAAGRPGGVMSLSQVGVTFLRLQETGDPRDYGMSDPGSNRKLLFGHSITNEIYSPTADTILDDGVTLTFRARIATTSPLDDAHPAGGGGISPWPASGDGYVIHDGGKGIGIHQQTGDKMVSFNLCLGSDGYVDNRKGLVMNDLADTNQTSPSPDVDQQEDDGGTLNLLNIAAPTDWHEFWITIEDDTTNTGTHLVKVYMDGSIVASDFIVTAGNCHGDPDYVDSYLAMEVGSTPQAGAIDIDFIAYKPGIYQPTARELIYVDDDASAGGDGLSWPTAFKYLQDALTIALSNDEIRVAQGIYKPDQGAGITPGNQVATFQLIDGVTIKGGYAGLGAADPNARDVNSYETILSGDIGTPGDNSDNSYHVVTGSGTEPNAVLDGFTITAGNAAGDGSGYPYNHTYFGGGMYNYQSSPTVTDCAFSENDAFEGGGGMYNYQSSPTVTNCAFSENDAFNGGGGMCNFANSSPTVINCSFNSNSAYMPGGGMYNDGSSPTLTNCTFYGNFLTSGTRNGGGMCNWFSSNPIVTNCILWGDGYDEIADAPSSSSTVNYSDVQGGWPGTGNIEADPLFVNAAGGDLRLSSSASPCVDAGAGVPGLPPTDLAGNPRIVDGDRNGTAVVDMGAFELQNRQIHNITQARWYDSIQVSIDDANDGDQIEVGPGTYYESINFNGKAVRLYSIGGPEVTTIDGTGYYHVVQCVSGEDANTILEGFTISGGNANGTYPDNCGGGMINNSSSPTVTDCNFSLNSAVNDGAGMYNYGNSNPTISNCRFSNNTAVWGAGMYNYQSSPTLSECTFTANTATNGAGGMGNNASSPTLTNCTFTSNQAVNEWGGGMVNYNSSPTVTNCTFSGNSADDGGGMWNGTNSEPNVTDCNFSGNEAGYNGGGMYNDSSSPTLTNCTFSNNSAKYGGGMGNNASSPTLTNCTFISNQADSGGGMFNNQSSPTVSDCRFTGNSAVGAGGGMRNNDSSTTVTNCTFSGNSADYGGGMFNDYGSSPTVTNCTFSSNSASNGGGMYNSESNPTLTNCILCGDTLYEISNIYSTPNVTYSDVQGGYAGTGNINADPCFVDDSNPDPTLWNLRLADGSPCIDAGDNTAVPASVLKDLAGKLRFADDPCTPDTGDAGTTGRPVVDMGAYEFQGSATTSQNLLANPGFELGDATGWITNWGFSLTADTNQVHDGNYSGLASNRTASWQGAWQSLLGLMDDGKTYRISGWVRLQSEPNDYVALIVKKTDSTGTSYYGIDNATAYNDKWVHLDGTLALDVIGQPTELYVYFEGPAQDVNFYVDDAAVTEVIGDMNHNGGVDFIDFSLFASYYGFDCSTQDCGRANLDDSDNTINERDLAILCNNWLAGTGP